MSISTTAGDVQIGPVISQTIAAARANFQTYFLIALICVALPDALFGALSLRNGNAASGGVVSLIGQNLVAASVVYGVVAQINGRKASFKECFDAAGKLLVPLLGLAILASLGIILGLVLLIVPGIILACMWAVATPARVVEGPGVQRALGRSRTLTQGHRLKIALLFLIFLVPLAVASALIGAVFAFAGEMVVEVIVTPLLSAVASVIGAAGAAVLYMELRRAKEGVGPESLASVFD